MGEEKKLPDGLYSTVDKSKKKKKAQGVLIRPYTVNIYFEWLIVAADIVTNVEDEDKHGGRRSTAINPTANTTYPFPEPAATDPFFLPPTSSSPIKEAKEEDGLANPFQLDPFLFSPQPGANSFNLAPGADPFSLPPLPTDTPAPDLGLDIFNFDPPLTGVVPSSNGTSNPLPLTGNPLSDVSNPSGLNFDIDLLDDRLFDTLAQLDVQDGGSEKEDPGRAARAGRGHKKTAAKKLSKQEFDDLWDGISAAMPTSDS